MFRLKLDRLKKPIFLFVIHYINYTVVMAFIASLVFYIFTLPQVFAQDASYKSNMNKNYKCIDKSYSLVNNASSFCDVSKAKERSEDLASQESHMKFKLQELDILIKKGVGQKYTQDDLSDVNKMRLKFAEFAESEHMDEKFKQVQDLLFDIKHNQKVDGVFDAGQRIRDMEKDVLIKQIEYIKAFLGNLSEDSKKAKKFEKRYNNISQGLTQEAQKKQYEAYINQLKALGLKPDVDLAHKNTYEKLQQLAKLKLITPDLISYMNDRIVEIRQDMNKTKYQIGVVYNEINYMQQEDAMTDNKVSSYNTFTDKTEQLQKAKEKQKALEDQVSQIEWYKEIAERDAAQLGRAADTTKKKAEYFKDRVNANDTLVPQLQQRLKVYEKLLSGIQQEDIDNKCSDFSAQFAFVRAQSVFCSKREIYESLKSQIPNNCPSDQEKITMYNEIGKIQNQLPIDESCPKIKTAYLNIQKSRPGLSEKNNWSNENLEKQCSNIHLLSMAQQVFSVHATSKCFQDYEYAHDTDFPIPTFLNANFDEEFLSQFKDDILTKKSTIHYTPEAVPRIKAIDKQIR